MDACCGFARVMSLRACWVCGASECMYGALYVLFAVCFFDLGRSALSLFDFAADCFLLIIVTCSFFSFIHAIERGVTQCVLF